MARVRIDGVTRRFGGAVAVAGVSLDIPSGEFLTILGPSGCGKTTTLRMVSGLTLPDAGHILIGGRDVTQVPSHKRNIAMVFQSHALFPHMTVADNVAFGLRMRGIGRRDREGRAMAALAMVRLDGFAGRLPAQLSGGQQQRVALARALVTEPDVLLLDEPFGALDRKLRGEMQVELRALVRQTGVTALFVTHDQEEALVLSDRIVVMRDGRIEQVGPPREIYARPRTAFVADFMGVETLLRGRVSANGFETGGLTLTLPSGARMGPALAAIRAEAVSLAPGGIPATVTGEVYGGAQVRLTLDAGGVALVAALPAQAGPVPSTGDRVAFAIDPAAIGLLPAEEGPA
jgi:putative spermidine/putrescine transport system ATP-binding protein